MTDIADRLVRSRSGLTYQIAQLAEAGLVTKAPSPDDERSVIVSLTPQGRALLGGVRGHGVAVVSAAKPTYIPDQAKHCQDLSVSGL